jgi:hypothetical protein
MHSHELHESHKVPILKIRGIRGRFRVSLFPAVSTDAEKIDLMTFGYKSRRCRSPFIKCAAGYLE